MNQIIYFEPGLKPVIKFNPNHDEAGRFTTGTSMGAGVAQSILDRVKANGGLSVNMVDGSEPTSGYMVAKGTQYGTTVSAANFYDPSKGPQILLDYMKKNKSDLATGKNYLGLWHNTEDGNVYLDVSQNIQDKSTAISAGQSRNQISIWDVANFAEIQTGGTGVAKQEDGSGGTADEHRGNDGFGIGSLRAENLGEVSKTQIIRFAPGLKPIIKFNPYHDERGRFTTGTGYAQGGYTAEQTYRQNQMKGKGPTVAALDSYLALQTGRSSYMGTAHSETVAMIKQFNEVYGIKAGGLTSKVTTIASFGKKIVVFGEVYDANGVSVGRIERQLTRQASGYIVEHKLLKINDSARGRGFGKKFIAQQEAYYVNNKFKKITMMTGWDGARHWARAGYDFDPGVVNQRKTFKQLALYAGARGFTDNGTPSGRKFNELMKKVSPDWFINPLTQRGSFLSDTPKFHPRSNSFPIPNDFATIGYKRGATDWEGKNLLKGLNLYYVKNVNSPGYNIKKK
jgi:hypothetical protein